MTGCSPNTLRKHGDLWRLFAAGSGVCSSPRPALLSQGARSESGFVALSASDFCSVVLESVSDPVIRPGSRLCSEESTEDNGPSETETDAKEPGLLRVCSPVLNGRWRRRGTVTGRKAEVPFSPALTQPSTGSKHRLLRFSGTCGLNGSLPASGSPPAAAAVQQSMGHEYLQSESKPVYTVPGPDRRLLLTQEIRKSVYAAA